MKKLTWITDTQWEATAGQFSPDGKLTRDGERVWRLAGLPVVICGYDVFVPFSERA